MRAPYVQTTSVRPSVCSLVWTTKSYFHEIRCWSSRREVVQAGVSWKSPGWHTYIGIHVVWNVTTCRWASSYRCFERNVGPSSSNVILHGPLESFDNWRHNDHSKLRSQLSQRHGVASGKTWIRRNAVVRTSHLSVMSHLLVSMNSISRDRFGWTGRRIFKYVLPLRIVTFVKNLCCWNSTFFQGVNELLTYFLNFYPFFSRFGGGNIHNIYFLTTNFVNIGALKPFFI